MKLESHFTRSKLCFESLLQTTLKVVQVEASAGHLASVSTYRNMTNHVTQANLKQKILQEELKSIKHHHGVANCPIALYVHGLQKHG